MLTKHTHKQTQTHTYIINVSPYFILINKIINKTKWNKWINTIRCNNVQATNGATVKSFNNYTVSALSRFSKNPFVGYFKKGRIVLDFEFEKKKVKTIKSKKVVFFSSLSSILFIINSFELFNCVNVNSSNVIYHPHQLTRLSCTIVKLCTCHKKCHVSKNENLPKKQHFVVAFTKNKIKKT